MTTTFSTYGIMDRLQIAARGTTSLLLVTVIAAHLTGCASKPDLSPKIQAEGLAFRYDSARDRLVYFGPEGGPNLLEVRDLEQEPDPAGEYTFFGGHYTWIAPQNLWRNVDGELMNWPPDPVMDRGPKEYEIISEGVMRAVGPRGRSGLAETTTFEILDDATFRVRHTLRNESRMPQRAAVWSITAAKPRNVFAVPMDEDALFTAEDEKIRLDNEDARPLWNTVARKVDHNWIVVDTSIGLAIPGWDPDSFKAFFTATEGTRIAIWSDGYWLLRSGEPVDVFNSLEEVGESAVEIYANFGLRLFEAELLGPYVEIEPGDEIYFEETWRVIPSATPDVTALDR